MEIRRAFPQDLEAVTEVEAACFPPAEAATREQFAERIERYGNHFLLLWDGGRLIGFIDGMVTDLPDLTDEMYASADMHDEAGSWQMIFGLNTLPEYRNRGYAGQLVKALIRQAENEKRTGVVLACKDHMIPYYSRFGFRNEGPSPSVHGGAVWYQMRLTFGKAAEPEPLPEE